MQTVNVIQGSSEWHQARDSHFCASDAPAMMGVSKYKSRADLLKEKATGITPEISPEKQALFDCGHAAEAAIRPYIASIIGDELFPVVLEEGKLLSSLDGITIDDETVFEHKLFSEDLAAQIRSGELEPHYWVQLEQQLFVSKAKRVIFVCSDGTPEKCVHMFYMAVPGQIEKILAGWNQFEADLRAYSAPLPDPVLEKKALMALPALSVQLVGKVTTSNLPAYRNSALEFIGKINTDLQNDQDFADAEQTVKFCESAEKNLRDVKEQAIAQTATIDELFRAIDQISDAMRQKRLMLDKLVKSRKEQIRTEIVQDGRRNWNTHIGALNASLSRVMVTVLVPDFATAIKGKRTLASLRDAVDSALTTAKIAATQQAELFASRLAIIDEVAKDHAFLVRDLSVLVAMPTETLSAVIRQRITDHQAEQDRKAAAAKVEQEHKDELTRQAESARVQREKDAAALRVQVPATPVVMEHAAPELAKAPDAMSVVPGMRGGEPVAVAATYSMPQYPLAPRPSPTAEALEAAVANEFQTTPETARDWLRKTYGQKAHAA